MQDMGARLWAMEERGRGFLQPDYTGPVSSLLFSLEIWWGRG